MDPRACDVVPCVRCHFPEPRLLRGSCSLVCVHVFSVNNLVKWPVTVTLSNQKAFYMLSVPLRRLWAALNA